MLNLVLAVLSLLVFVVGGFKFALLGPVIVFALFAYLCWRRLQQR